MKKLVIESNKPMFCYASILVNSDYSFDNSIANGRFPNKEQERKFHEEVREKLPFGDFTVVDDKFSYVRITNAKDDRQHIVCHPSCIVYTGSTNGLDKLTKRLEEEDFKTFSFVKVNKPVVMVYDMTKEEVKQTLDANTDIIHDNLKEYVDIHNPNYKYDIIDSVFEYIRFPNMHDKLSYSMNWSSEETAYDKTLEVFNKMVKDKEIIMDEKNVFKVNQLFRKPIHMVSSRNYARQDKEVEFDVSR